MTRKVLALVLALTLAFGMVCMAQAKTISFLSIWAEDYDNGKLLTDLSAKYKEDHPDFDFELELVASDNLQQKVATLAVSNDLPDVFAYESGTPLKTMIENDYVLNVSEALRELGVEDCIDAGAYSFLTNLVGTEDLYDLPLGLNIEGFWYNKALFEKAGIEAAPTTWDEMLEDCEKLMAAGIQPFAVGGADQWPATRIINAYVMRKLGVDAMNKMAAGELSYTDPGMVEAAKMLQDMCQKGYFGVGPTTVDQNTAAQMILAGEAAILYNGSWYTQDLVADTNPAGEDGIGFFNIPTVEGGPGTLTEYSMNCGTILCLSKDKYDAETADWLKYIVTNLGDYAMSEFGALKGYVINEYPESMSKYSILVAEEMGKVTGTSTWFEAAMSSELSNIAQVNVQSLMNGEMTPEEYAQSLQDVWDSNN